MHVVICIGDEYFVFDFHWSQRNKMIGYVARKAAEPDHPYTSAVVMALVEGVKRSEARRASMVDG